MSISYRALGGWAFGPSQFSIENPMGVDKPTRDKLLGLTMSVIIYMALGGCAFGPLQFPIVSPRGLTNPLRVSYLGMG